MRIVVENANTSGIVTEKLSAARFANAGNKP